MKKLILLALMSAYAMSGSFNETETKAIETANENARLCKIFTHKVEAYKASMRKDTLAEATLVSYEKRKDSFCNTSSAEAVKEVKTIAAVDKENKKAAAVQSKNKIDETANESARLCNVFTKKVKKYESTMRDDVLAKTTLDSYKQRMTAYCNASSSTRS